MSADPPTNCPGPGDAHYIIGSPLFDQATITTAQGKAFKIIAEGNGPLKLYIRGATLNGESFNKTFLGHDEILAGGEIVFKMTSAPDKKWGSALESRPPSGMSGLSGGK